MNSQINNQGENQEQVFQEDQFRKVCFDSSKRSLTSSSNDQSKRVRLDTDSATFNTATASDHTASVGPSASQKYSNAPDMSLMLKNNTSTIVASSGNGIENTGPQNSVSKPSTGSIKLKAPKYIRRFRSRSLPIINYHASKSHYLHTHHQHQKHSIPPLPPINLQSLKEIDLHEILKNPQLRHDILFDPQLQFRPNLDGERGRRKKSIIDRYWNEIQKECSQFFVLNPSNSIIEVSRLPILFSTLRDILLSLLPQKDRASVNEVMDIDLLVQQLSHGSFDFVSLSKWLGEVFKSHCAPMRDNWVSEMISKFDQAYKNGSVENLVQGLRMIFSILEAMKLDVANHQIRILRPVLIETAVDFEKDYFNQLISHCKIDISDSMKWFYKNFHKKQNSLSAFVSPQSNSDEKSLKIFIMSSIIDLLSCRNMVTEFPSTLAFDHTRLVLLRADVRQLVCVQLCSVLYKQLLISNGIKDPALFKGENISKIQEEILAIVTDDNGTIKWTRNIHAISLQLVKNVTNKTDVPKAMVDFSYNWLIKQIQPSSDVYGLMEENIFKDLFKEVMKNSESNITVEDLKSNSNTTEISNIAARISTLVKFHWSVFGSYYSDYLSDQEDENMK